MITKETFCPLLFCLGFLQKENTQIYIKHFASDDCDIEVDFSKKVIVYPWKIDTGENSTTNFLKDENMVVLECVCSLLEKGYRQQNIFLEKQWTLGHTQKGGRADITVFDKAGENVLFIIECKTAGKKYNRAKKELFCDIEGKQLFSYATQARSCKWLMLYASKYNLEMQQIQRFEEIIKCHDDKNILTLAQKQKDSSILLFKNASQARDIFNVWKETYEQRTYQGLILGKDALPYNIGVRPLKKKDLLQFTKERNISDEFKEILRHNVISDKENAFNKLLSLFICKMVDEKEKGENEVVDFQYKDGEDDYYSLYERLLALYQKGMDDYLHESVFYLENDYIHKMLYQYTGQNREELEKELKEGFQKTKLLSCQVFAFREIYNEMLFLQNGKVLVEVVLLLQNYRISYSSKEQFLGDLFEQLLGQGFKQDEGQFFTPIPITRFVWNSLPFERFCDVPKKTFPKVIDFACGAGHFLTEGISAIEDHFLCNGGRLEESTVSRNFYGVDKDNRLAKASKIALFLNGAENAKIKAMEGLEHDENFLGVQNSFDIVATNPPFSVDSFKAHLARQVLQKYEVLQYTSFSSGDIQNAFVERLCQLLKPFGVAGIIMPSSFLTTIDAGKTVARKILFENFSLKAIVCLGDKTFAQTGTATNILFLQKFSEPPKRCNVVKDSIEAILSKKDYSDWEDNEIFCEYSKKIGVEKKDYFDFIVAKTKSMSEWGSAKNEYFVQYLKEFEKTHFQENLEKKNETKTGKNKKSPQDVQELVWKKFFDMIEETEKQKLYYFALVYLQKTFIVTAPKDGEEQKRFLGYINSKSKVQQALREIEGLLTNKKDRNDRTKIAFYVKKSFENGFEEIFENAPPKIAECSKYYNTKDMFDFSSPVFSNTLKTSGIIESQDCPSKSKYPYVQLGNVAIDIQTGSRPVGGVGNLTTGAYSLGGEHIDNENGHLNLAVPRYVPIAFYENALKGKLQEGDFLICKDGALTGKVALVRDELKDKKAMINEHVFILRSKDIITQKYLFEFFHCDFGQVLLKQKMTGTAQGGLNSSNLKTISIPLPPLEVQKNIVAECEAIDEEAQKAKEEVIAGQKEIAELFANVEGERVRLGEVAEIIRGVTYAKDDQVANKTNNIILTADNVTLDGHFEVTKQIYLKDTKELPVEKRLMKDDCFICFSSGSKKHLGKLCYIENDTNYFAGGFMGILRSNKDKILPKFLYNVLNTENMRDAIRDCSTGSNIQNLSSSITMVTLFLPPLAIQEELVAKARRIEEKINSAQSVVAGAKKKKKAALECVVHGN